MISMWSIKNLFCFRFRRRNSLLQNGSSKLGWWHELTIVLTVPWLFNIKKPCPRRKISKSNVKCFKSSRNFLFSLEKSMSHAIDSSSILNRIFTPDLTIDQKDKGTGFSNSRILPLILYNLCMTRHSEYKHPVTTPVSMPAVLFK